MRFDPARWVWAALGIGLGVGLGGYLFAGVQPRSLLALPGCGSSCFQPSELAGLLVSIGVQRTPGLLPGVVKETERCITIKHPFPEARVHLVVFPKRDIKDIGSLGAEDAPFVLECLAHIQSLVAEHKLRVYRVITNGPAARTSRTCTSTWCRGERRQRVSSPSSSARLAATMSTSRSTSSPVMHSGGASRTTCPRA
jgi:Scavenger mRNA decapping enzyme C-term binding